MPSSTIFFLGSDYRTVLSLLHDMSFLGDSGDSGNTPLLGGIVFLEARDRSIHGGSLCHGEEGGNLIED